MKELTLGFCPQGNGYGDIQPFDQIFSHKKDISKGIEGVDAVVFWGGADIHPGFYEQERHSKSQANSRPSERDYFEWRAMVYCKLHNIPMIGVCRGAQMMCAFAGGELVQHCNHHNTGGHSIVTHDGKRMYTTSAHHQMMIPWKVQHELLAWTDRRQSTLYEGEHDQPIPEMYSHNEPEVVYFPKIRGLAIQGHPEWMNATDPLVQWFNELIIDKLLIPSFEKEKANA